MLLAALLFATAMATPVARLSAFAPAAVQEAGAGGDAGHETSTAGEWKPVIAKAVNFAILVGILVYFLRAPLSGYLSSRIAKVREDLVAAAELRDTATRQLAEIDAKLKALPAEIDALRIRGKEDMAAERVRIEQAAEAERQRLLEHTRREIETRLRVAKRELVELTAELAVQAATARITKTITPADQARLVDRYTAQVGRAGSSMPGTRQ